MGCYLCLIKYFEFSQIQHKPCVGDEKMLDQQIEPSWSKVQPHLIFFNKICSHECFIYI